jgi:hypothetical protein
MSGPTRRAPRPRHVLALVTLLALLLTSTGERTLAQPASSVTLTLSNPSCVQPSSAAGMCYVAVRTAYAQGSDPSFSALELSVDGKVRLRLLGFFESQGFVEDRMIRPGLRVACGLPGASGDPAYGLSHLIAARASMADGSFSTGSVTVRCPAFDGRRFVPEARR